MNGDQAFALGWSLAGLAVAVILFLNARRLGSGKAAAWLVVVGLVILAMEDPLVTWFWGMSTPDTDPDGMSGVVTSTARAHVIDSAIFGTAFFILVGWIALTAFRRGERWALRALTAGWVLVAVTMVVTLLTVSSRGLPFSSVGDIPGRTPVGWEQVLVGLLAWGAGLWLVRSARYAREPVHSGG